MMRLYFEAVGVVAHLALALLLILRLPRVFWHKLAVATVWRFLALFPFWRRRYVRKIEKYMALIAKAGTPEWVQVSFGLRMMEMAYCKWLLDYPEVKALHTRLSNRLYELRYQVREELNTILPPDKRMKGDKA